MRRTASLKAIFIVLLFLFLLTPLMWDFSGPDVFQKTPTFYRGDYSYAIHHAENRISYLMTEYHLPCFAFAMVDDQKVIYQAVSGYKDLQEGLMADLETLFRVCSISKVFTAIEIMRLYEEGLVDIDLPLSKYIPLFFNKKPFQDEDPVTLRKILAHRSGLPRNGCLLPWHWDGQPNVLEDVVRSLKYSYMAYPPGYRYKYSNVGFDILGHIIEKKRKKLFPEYMDRDVLPDMDMEESTFLPLSDDIGRIARGYSYAKGTFSSYGRYELNQMASANLHSTIPDICDFMRFIFRKGQVGQGQRIKGETLEMMFQPQYSWPGDPHENGLAWRTDTHRFSELTVFHHGICMGTQSLIALMPEKKQGIVLICNSSSIDDSILLEFGFEILGLMLQTIDGVLPKSESGPQPSGSPQTSSEKDQYEGKYCLDGEIIELFIKSEDLKVKIEPGEMELLPLEGRRFSLSSDMRSLERFGKIEVEFFLDEISKDWMIHIFRGGMYVGTAIKCPVLDETALEKWRKLEGKYEAYPRFESRFTGEKRFGHAEIILKDNFLLLPSHRAVLMPLNDMELVIRGGLFDGETMLYDPVTGYITWQDVVYFQVSEDSR